MMESRLRNLYVNNSRRSYDFSPPGGGDGKGSYPDRSDRRAHADKLESDLIAAWNEAQKQYEDVKAVSVATRHGVYLEIKGKAGYDLITKSLENTAQQVRLCNIKVEDDDENRRVISSTVYVPDNKREFFIKKINKYRETATGEEVVGTIESINLAFVNALWTSKKTKMPIENPEWCEVWLMYETKETMDEVVNQFFEICKQIGIEHKEQKIVFPERVVLAVRAAMKQLSELQRLSSRIAEFRIMVSPTGFFGALSEMEQSEFVQEIVVDPFVKTRFSFF